MVFRPICQGRLPNSSCQAGRSVLAKTMTMTMNSPPPLSARLVFMATAESWLSRAIMFDEMGAVSHVAAMMDDGLFVSSNQGQGVRRTRQLDELNGVTMQITVDMPMIWHQYESWRDFLYSKVGEPFDSAAIIGIATRFDLHTQNSLICSALQVDSLRHCGYFARPLAQKYHMISPVVLLLMLQAQQLSTGVTIHDPVYETLTSL